MENIEQNAAPGKTPAEEVAHIHDRIERETGRRPDDAARRRHEAFILANSSPFLMSPEMPDAFLSFFLTLILFVVAGCVLGVGFLAFSWLASLSATALLLTGVGAATFVAVWYCVHRELRD